MVKIKCVKAECPICGKKGSCQLFLNKQNEVIYARVRHYLRLNPTTKKPQFEYHKVEDLEALKTLLKTKGVSFSTGKANKGQIDQKQAVSNIAPKLKYSSLNLKMGAGPLGFEPRTFSLEG